MTAYCSVYACKAFGSVQRRQATRWLPCVVSAGRWMQARHDMRSRDPKRRLSFETASILTDTSGGFGFFGRTWHDTALYRRSEACLSGRPLGAPYLLIACANPARSFGTAPAVPESPSAIRTSFAATHAGRRDPTPPPLSRTSRNQKAKVVLLAVRANLDDPPLHMRPTIAAISGCKTQEPFSSGHRGLRGFMIGQYLRRKTCARRQASVRTPRKVF
jgi:hypothetical protein